jgi:FtsP/CotA-like multicopper oxidase with cupredoxin domain/PKD repeat protein
MKRGQKTHVIRTDQTILFCRKLLMLIFLAGGLLLVTGIGSADNTSSTNVAGIPDGRVLPNQALNVTQVHTTPIPDVTTKFTIRPKEIVEPAASSGNTKISLPVLAAAKADAINFPQFHLRMNSSRVSLAEKEAAAANYKPIREVFLTQTPQAQQTSGRGIVGAAPMQDPGGVPHYFGPYPNWANSPMPKGTISSIRVEYGGSGYTAPVVTIADVYFTGSGATASATVYGGIITGITVTSLGTGYSAPVVIISDPTGSGVAATAILGPPFTGGIRKFVDTLPGLNAGGANNLGQYIPVAIPDKTTYPGSDYYEIELGEYTEKLHSDLPNTTLRGYRQTNTIDPTISKFHNLGPMIIALNGTPVRVKFTNKLPTGAGGRLFLPVDTTVMGAGMGPLGMNTTPAYYTENRATLHLHGGNTPWISDGTPYQWITPAGESTAYPEGVSVYNVPDMPDPGDGSQTFFYTNQQSARLMFYHDHSHGLTRLNVYAGGAGGYLVTDPVEKDMIDGTNTAGINPAFAKVLPDIGIPLIIQDKTFVDASTIGAQDPTWNWGTTPGIPNTGDLWYPHVYMPAQNPYDDTGVNPYGRWHYGPWFFPPTVIAHGPVANPYFGEPGEPPMMPGTPNPSMAGEAFMDTAMVNGAAYPNLTVEPRAYRFRILNAADDRFVNLQLYVADSNTITSDGRINTEVRIVPAVVTAGFPSNWPTDQRVGGVPDPATRGPSFIQIGTEGGFLPAPVIVQNQPITWVSDPTRFDFGNVDKFALFIAAAERADVIVDFSQYAGKTLILYNDAPAPTPAGVPVNDYYTGKPDLTSVGGTPATQPGYGPNTRTIMQIKVANTTPAPVYNVTTLNSVFAKTSAKRGVFEVSQPPVIIPQIAYSSAYNTVFPVNNFIRIADSFKNFTTISGTWLNITFQPKALHDEMGAVYDEYGRMSGMLGLEVPSQTSITSNFMPYTYSSPPTDVLMTSVDPMSVPSAGDGTQIWKISHNGVDTHPLHWHLYNVQVINRVGWDGFIRPPDATELGWKETLRVSPLEDTIIAMRPVAPTLPFTIPDNVRAIDPTMPLGNVISGPPGGFFDPLNEPVTVTNHLVNLGWEYVWHCHILAHEEMDMMHSQAIAVTPPGSPPNTLVSGTVVDGATNTTSVYLAWMDQSTHESDWTIQRRNLSDAIWYDLKRVPSYSTSQTGVWAMAIDASIPPDTDPIFAYRIKAANVIGDDTAYTAPSVGFPIIALNSTASTENVPQSVAPPGVATIGITPGSTGDVAFNVTFNGTSSNATGWIWDFGDGNYAGDNGKQNPSHVFQIPGTYTVTLTGMNTGGKGIPSAPSIITVTKAGVPAAPIANFINTSPREGAAPFTVTFNADTSTSIPEVWATWRWSFGDGTFSSSKNVSHTFSNAGNYTVSLIATNLGGTNVMTRSGYINVSPGAPNDGIAIFRPSTGFWYFDNNLDSVVNNSFRYGGSADQIIKGDWQGTGRDGIAIFRPSTGFWYFDYNLDGTVDNSFRYGGSTDRIITGKWNSTVEGIAIFRPSTGYWYFDNNLDGTVDKSFRYGGSTDQIIAGDWQGTGRDGIAIFRPSTGYWYFDYNLDGTVNKSFRYGGSTDSIINGKWA